MVRFIKNQCGDVLCADAIQTTPTSEVNTIMKYSSSILFVTVLCYSCHFALCGELSVSTNSTINNTGIEVDERLHEM